MCPACAEEEAYKSNPEFVERRTGFSHHLGGPRLCFTFRTLKMYGLYENGFEYSMDHWFIFQVCTLGQKAYSPIQITLHLLVVPSSPLLLLFCMYLYKDFTSELISSD